MFGAAFGVVPGEHPRALLDHALPAARRARRACACITRARTWATSSCCAGVRLGSMSFEELEVLLATEKIRVLPSAFRAIPVIRQAESCGFCKGTDRMESLVLECRSNRSAGSGAASPSMRVRIFLITEIYRRSRSSFLHSSPWPPHQHVAKSRRPPDTRGMMSCAKNFTSEE